MNNEEVMQGKLDLAIKTLEGFGFEFKKRSWNNYLVTNNGDYIGCLFDVGILEMAKRELANRLMCFDFSQEMQSIRAVGETMSIKVMNLIKNGTIDEEVSDVLLEAGIRLNESVSLITEASKKYHGVVDDGEHYNDD
jgi:hypothetical protein